MTQPDLRVGQVYEKRLQNGFIERLTVRELPGRRKRSVLYLYQIVEPNGYSSSHFMDASRHDFSLLVSTAELRAQDDAGAKEGA